MKSLLLTLIVAILSVVSFADSASAQAGNRPSSPTQTSPGAGRDVTHANSTSTVRFEGLTDGGSVTSGTRWIKIGEHWQKSGTWVKHGDDIDCYADDGTKVFTNGGAGNFSNKRGPVTDHLGGTGTTWNAV